MTDKDERNPPFSLGNMVLSIKNERSRTGGKRFVIRWLVLSSRLALNGKQAEKRVIFYLEQFPGDLAV